MKDELYKLLADKYTAAELVDILDLPTDAVVDALDAFDMILDEFCDGGKLQTEWEELLYGE